MVDSFEQYTEKVLESIAMTGNDHKNPAPETLAELLDDNWSRAQIIKEQVYFSFPEGHIRDGVQMYLDVLERMGETKYTTTPENVRCHVVSWIMEMHEGGEATAEQAQDMDLGVLIAEIADKSMMMALGAPRSFWK